MDKTVNNTAIFNVPTRILIAVNQVNYHEFCGQWYTPYYPKGVSFKSFLELVNGVDDFYNRHNLVSPSTQSRSLIKAKLEKVVSVEELKRYMSEEIFLKNKGEKATFLIQVMYRQNATWQGVVKMLATGEERRFRSTLELIKMMDESIIEKLSPDE